MNDVVDKFLAQNFFGLEGFAYPELFGLNKMLWSGLDEIDSFLSRFSFKSDEEIFIGKDCKIDRGAKIEGPVIIGDRCDIRFGAYIRPGTIIGSDCVIGHGSEVVRSILLNRVKIPHLNYVGDSIIGSNVNLGAGSKCANVRLDRGEIELFHQGVRFNSKRKKLGALIGENASIGCNAVLNPGTIVLPGRVVPPCMAVKGIIS